MSYTVPPRRQAPAVYRGPQDTRGKRDSYNIDEQSSSLPTASPDSTGPQHQQQEIHRASGYHVIAPNPEKNSKLRQKAREEEAIYTSYKERKRASQAGRLYASSRLGGEPLPSDIIDTMRERQERQARTEAKTLPIRRQMERERRREEQMSRETAKIEEHKMRQREKSERLERKRALTESARQEEMRRKRLEYFDKR